ncbi:MAG: radical SAM protein [Deferribacteres bacterium]|nr:radical SAM protein [candidate division KSB1 bacterium]MCB9501357.1 radical SAM protein [Deferribacteres bacterium]
MANKKRLNVHLYVTPLCNLACKHCYYNAKSREIFSGRLLTILEMKEIVTILSDSYAAAFDVEGGEFFLRPDIDELFEVVPSHYWNNITITTNGTVNVGIDPKHLRCLDEFRISVEGHTDELQHDIRGINLSPVLETCLHLHSNRVPVTLRITLHKKNYKYLPEMIEKFIALGFTKFSMYEFQPVGQGYSYRNEYSLNQLEIEKIFNLLLSFTNYEKIELLKLSLSRKRIPIVTTYRSKFVRIGYNVADLSGISSLTINYNGEIGICPWNVGDDVIGLFYKDDFKTDISKYVERGLFNHFCDYCSAIRIIYQQPKGN